MVRFSFIVSLFSSSLMRLVFLGFVASFLVSDRWENHLVLCGHHEVLWVKGKCMLFWGNCRVYYFIDQCVSHIIGKRSRETTKEAV